MPKVKGKVASIDKVIDNTSSNVPRQKDVYFNWLGKYMGANGDYFPNKTYWDLFHKLFSIDFYYTVPLDENRQSDGLSVRNLWLNEELSMGHDEIDISSFGPCSMLEMMAGLSIRIEQDIMQDPNRGDRTRFWFWTMIHNLGLDIYDDSHISYNALDIIHMAITNVLERNYDDHGNGSLFPLKEPPEDMREVEIWYQMNWFLRENKTKFED